MSLCSGHVAGLLYRAGVKLEDLDKALSEQCKAASLEFEQDFRNSPRDPEKVRTEDGNVFTRQSDGVYATDNYDMSFDSLDDLADEYSNYEEIG